MVLTEESKLKKIKKRTLELLLLTSAHGLPRFLRAKNFFMKLIWLITLIVSSLAGANFIIKNIFDYIQFEAITTINLINERVIEFPTISLCSSPGFITPLNETVFSLRFDRIQYTNFTDFFESFNDSIYGRCFRFNSGKNMFNKSVNIIKTSRAGYQYGLKLEINLESPTDYDFSELMIYIHNKSMPPSGFDENFYWGSTGSWIYFNMERIFYQNLGPPYSDCLKDVNEFQLDRTIINYFNIKRINYSQKDCFKYCSFLFALEHSNCKCNSSLEKFKKDCEISWNAEDKNNITKLCIEKYLNNFRNENIFHYCSSYCPLECDRMELVTTPYVEQFPTNGLIGNKSKEAYNLVKFENYQQVNKKWIVLIFYYKDLNYMLVSQHQKFELFTFVSNIGGICSLFFGISFLSFIEIFELVFEAILICFRPNK